MPVGIIIGTHGEAARELLKSTEMIIGKQDNVEFITFVPGENTDTLITKYKEKLDKLDTSEGVILWLIYLAAVLITHLVKSPFQKTIWML